MDSKELRLIKEAYASIYTEQVESLQESVEELDESRMKVLNMLGKKVGLRKLVKAAERLKKRGIDVDAGDIATYGRGAAKRAGKQGGTTLSKQDVRDIGTKTGYRKRTVQDAMEELMYDGLEYDEAETVLEAVLEYGVEIIDETVKREDPRMQGRKAPSPGDGEKSRPLPTPRGPRKPMPESTKGRTDQLPKRTPENAKKVEYYKDDVDIFDIVKGHLMSEGYADTEEAALAIMANMSEEWRQSIVEMGLTPDQESRRRDLAKALYKVGTPGHPKPGEDATIKMQKEYIGLQKLKGV